MKNIPADLDEILAKLSAQQQRLFACDCAEHVLPYFERFMPLDKRPRIAIEVARRYAVGTASLQELDEASDNADSAASEAAETAWGEIPDGQCPQPQDDAAAQAASAAACCATPDSNSAVEAVIDEAIEATVIAAVGIRVADAVWRKDWNAIDGAMLQQYQAAETQERAWQLKQAQRYLPSNLSLSNSGT